MSSCKTRASPVGPPWAFLEFSPCRFHSGSRADLTYDLSRPDRLTVTLRFWDAPEPLVLRFDRVR